MQITLYNGLTFPAKQVLRSLLDSSQSELIAVAECLNTIAENADEEKQCGIPKEELSSQDSYLVMCAREIKHAAQRVIDALEVAPSSVEFLDLLNKKTGQE